MFNLLNACSAFGCHRTVKVCRIDAVIVSWQHVLQYDLHGFEDFA